MERSFKMPSARGFALAALLLAACDDTPGAQPAADAALPGVVIGDAGPSAFDGGALPGLPATPQLPGDAGVTAHDASLQTDGAVQTDAGATPSSSTLPSVSDLKQPGPFTPTRTAGPSGYVLFTPKELGKGGVKHPVVSWGPGAAEDAGMFTTLLNHLASHGFAVISFDGTPQDAELTKGLDWLLAENARADGPLFQKLDSGKVAIGGHSAGSIATFKVAADPRVTTTLHISGGTFDPHTDINNLHAPALFVCGEPAVDGLLVGDVARANCDLDFQNAKVPVFYGVTKGASHMTPTEIGDAALRTLQLAAITGWLRWQLASDAGNKGMFAGSACTLCKDAGWTVQQKSLD
jgi:hypothetical protein